MKSLPIVQNDEDENYFVSDDSGSLDIDWKCEITSLVEVKLFATGEMEGRYSEGNEECICSYKENKAVESAENNKVNGKDLMSCNWM
jgi:hypothetical protein